MTALFSHWAEISLGTGVVLLFLFFLRPLLERACPARWRCWVWLILAARLVVPWSLSGPWSPFRFLLPGPAERPAPTASVEELATLERDALWTGATTAGLVPLEKDAVSTAGPDGVEKAVLSMEMLPVLVWCLGAAAMLGFHGVAYLRFVRRVRRWSRPAGSYEGLPVAECLAVETPLLLGFRHPTLVLPRGLEGEDREFALLHEYTHFRRGDLWRKLLLLAANALHWWNPAVWLLRRAGERDMEMACDEDVLAGKDLAYRRRYGQALLRTLTGSLGAAGAMTTGFALGMGGLKQRFAALVEVRRRPLGRGTLALALGLALLGGGLVSCSETAGGGLESLQPSPDTPAWEEAPSPSQDLAQTPPAAAERSWSGVVWARCGTWDGAAQTFTFQPLTVDEERLTWTALEEGTWTLTLGEDAVLPPISQPDNGLELDRETYLETVFRAEPLENSAGDCLLRLTTVDGAIVEAQWRTPYQKA